MKFLKFNLLLAASVMMFAVFTSCSDSDDPKPEPNVEDLRGEFHIAFANGSESISATLVQGLKDLSQGVVSPEKGHSLESSRTARIFISTDGSKLYSLNYTEGTIEKLGYKGGDQYVREARIDASVPLGAKTVRFTKLDDKVGSVHYIKATPQYNADNEYQKHTIIASVGMLDLEKMTMIEGYKKELPVELPEEFAKAGYYISRIDAPVVSGSKLYYGAAVSIFNPSTGKGLATDRTFTLVMDYPSLSNPTVISRTDVKGSTNGYRTPTQHKNEAGEILQMVSGNDEVHIVKIKDGAYDTSFNYNLSKLLNKPTKSNGWFYAGNGIGYIPYEDLSKDKIQIGVNPQGEPSYSAMWKLARMDFNKGTVVDLEVPDNLWLAQYQMSVVRNGVFYIALAPIGIDGNVYMFDVKSESPKGTLGAKVTGTGADQYFIGIF